MAVAVPAMVVHDQYTYNVQAEPDRAYYHNLFWAIDNLEECSIIRHFLGITLTSMLMKRSSD